MIITYDFQSLLYLVQKRLAIHVPHVDVCTSVQKLPDVREVYPALVIV